MQNLFVKTKLGIKNALGQTATATASASGIFRKQEIKEITNTLTVLTTTQSQSAALATIPTTAAKNANKDSTTLTSDIETTGNSGLSSTRWTAGGIINGYFYWQGNFVTNSTQLQNCAKYVSATQPSNGSSSNIVAGSFTYVYQDGVPTNAGINAVWLFSGWSNAATALSSTINYTTGSDTYTNTYNYLKGTGKAYLLGITFGGGSSGGAWNTGAGGGIYSIYQAVTLNGYGFSYVETGTGQILTGFGTGILNNKYNSIMLDIETWNGKAGSTGTDFLNLCNYIIIPFIKY